jgi:hypothetical protein
MKSCFFLLVVILFSANFRIPAGFDRGRISPDTPLGRESDIPSLLRNAATDIENPRQGSWFASLY